VIVDCRQKKIVDRFRTYIKPVVHPNLYPFCTELTGITQDKVDAGILLEDALVALDKFLDEKVLVQQFIYSLGNLKI
jgi:inhibitor of KinA sporulation pathway (predicted exonuclease)